MFNDNSQGNEYSHWVPNPPTWIFAIDASVIIDIATLIISRLDVAAQEFDHSSMC